jgi:hypothetical protein
MLAVGLGIGVAAAHTPVASADSSTDPFSWLGGLDSPAAASTPDLNLAISFDGMSLVHDGNATATTIPGEHDFAIAYGDGASASATNGFGDFAEAGGTDAFAAAGGSSTAFGNFDTAIDIGNNTAPKDGAFAGAGSLIGGPVAGGTGSNDTAIDIGNNTGTGDNGAFAGAGGLFGGSGNGNYDTATDFGNNVGQDDGAAAVGGNFDSASDYGNITGRDVGSLSGFGDNDIASVIGTSAGSSSAGGNPGTDILSNNDIAVVVDPMGTLGNSVVSGASATAPGDFDLGAVFGDGLSSTMATGGNFLTDIVPSLF